MSPEPSLFSNSIRAVITKLPETRLHCVGHSAGGHLCVAASQQVDLSFDCIVSASAALEERLKKKYQHNYTGRFPQYDPYDHVKNTKVRRLIIVGDPNAGGDKQVHKIAWEAFYKKAIKSGLNVEYKKVPGKGHRTVSDALGSIRRCLAESKN